MFRLTQILQNSLIRLEGWLYQFFNLMKNLFSWLKQLLIFLGKLLGFTDAQDFLETKEEQSLKPTEKEVAVPSKANLGLLGADSTTRRRPDSKMKDFIKMAQQLKISR